MRFRYSVLTALTVLMFATSGQASIHIYGDLRTDTTESVILDTVTGREYLRFDEFDLTYAQTVAATSAGGIYEDWSIATSEIGDDFIEALFSNPLVPTTHAGDAIDPNIWSQSAGTISGWSEAAFGDSYRSGTDYFAFLSTQLTAGRPERPIGLGRISRFGLVRENDDWTTIAGLDSLNRSRNRPVNLLLYRDSSVPEPTASIVWSSLLGVGLLINRRRR